MELEFGVVFIIAVMVAGLDFGDGLLSWPDCGVLEGGREGCVGHFVVVVGGVGSHFWISWIRHAGREVEFNGANLVVLLGL